VLASAYRPEQEINRDTEQAVSFACFLYVVGSPAPSLPSSFPVSSPARIDVWGPRSDCDGLNMPRLALLFCPLSARHGLPYAIVHQGGAGRAVQYIPKFPCRMFMRRILDTGTAHTT
jgi:hypothetical protein